LLRLKDASSTLDDLAGGSFAPVIDDPGADKSGGRRLVLCSGKIYYALAGHEERPNATTLAIARLEQLYPFPAKEIAALLSSYPELSELVWAQEEPLNMGAYRSIRHRLAGGLAEAVSRQVPLRYVGRSWRASPSEGYPTAH